MTPEDLIDEVIAEDFIDEVIAEVRPRGTSAAVTHVLVAAVRAAAEIAVRTPDGRVDEENAREILEDSVEVLQTWWLS